MYHVVYMTRNNINGKVYVGVHSTYDIDDGYIGSGKILTRAINKYGKDQFTRTILHYCLNAQHAFEIESFIVDDAFVTRKDTYNTAIGGKGGNMVKHMDPERKKEMYDHIMAIRKQVEKTPEHKAKLSQHMKNINQIKKGVSISDEHKEKISKWGKGRSKNFSSEELQKRSTSMLGNNYGALKKRQWKLINALGHEYNIDDLPQFCAEYGINSVTLTTTYRTGHPKQGKKRFWEITKLEKINEL